MAAPAIAARTVKVVAGLAIRAAQERRSEDEQGVEKRHPISLPLFFFLLILALILDAATLVPILGTVFNFILAPIIWLTYYFVGAKELAMTLRILIILLATTGFFAELIPGVQMLPLNTIVAIAVYLLMSPRVTEAFERIKGVFGGAAPLRKVASVAKRATPVVRKVVAYAK